MRVQVSFLLFGKKGNNEYLGIFHKNTQVFMKMYGRKMQVETFWSKLTHSTNVRFKQNLSLLRKRERKELVWVNKTENPNR